MLTCTNIPPKGDVASLGGRVPRVKPEDKQARPWRASGVCDPESRLSGQAAFYGVWDSKALRSLLNGNPALKTALSAALNRKLAEKVAQAGVLTDVIGDTLEASTARAMPAKKSAKAKAKG